MGYNYRSPNQDPVSPPGSRNAWYMAKCKIHGVTSHQTPFGCEKCQTDRLIKQGLIKP